VTHRPLGHGSWTLTDIRLGRLLSSDSEDSTVYATPKKDDRDVVTNLTGRCLEWFIHSALRSRYYERLGFIMIVKIGGEEYLFDIQGFCWGLCCAEILERRIGEFHIEHEGLTSGLDFIVCFDVFVGWLRYIYVHNTRR
jgi:hypothetical protein